MQPYVPAYDTVDNYRIPDWLADTVYTRNTVTVRPSVLEQVRGLQGQLVQFKNAPEEFVQALKETLEAEVRSKFQTSRRIENSGEGVLVEVLFDETVVKYNWLAERVFEVVDVELVQHNKYIAEETAWLQQIETDKVAAADSNEQKNDASAGEGSSTVVNEPLMGDGVADIENNSDLSF